MSGVEEAKKSNGVISVSVAALPMHADHVSSSYDRLGYVIATGDTPDEASGRAEQAIQKLRWGLETLKRLILLGASEEGISAAHACGYHVIVIERPKKSISEKVTALAEAIYFADIWDTDAAHKVVEKIFSQYEDIKLILSFTELGLETAAYLSERYNLKTNPFETVRRTRNKNLMRNAFASHDDLKLQTFCGKADRLPEKISGLLPMIIKPNDGFGSQNVAYIKNQSDWEKWLRTHAQSKLEWILEPFIEGGV